MAPNIVKGNSRTIPIAGTAGTPSISPQPTLKVTVSSEDSSSHIDGFLHQVCTSLKSGPVESAKELKPPKPPLPSQGWGFVGKYPSFLAPH